MNPSASPGNRRRPNRPSRPSRPSLSVPPSFGLPLAPSLSLPLFFHRFISINDPAPPIPPKTPVLVPFDFQVGFDQVFEMRNKFQVFDGKSPAEPLLFVVGLDSHDFIRIR